MIRGMGNKSLGHKAGAKKSPITIQADGQRADKSSSLLDTRVVYCGDNLEQLAKFPDACVDLIYIDPPFNSNRTVEQLGEVFWGETKEKRAFEDRYASTQANIDYMRPRCVQLARVLKKIGSFTTTAKVSDANYELLAKSIHRHNVAGVSGGWIKYLRISRA